MAEKLIIPGQVEPGDATKEIVVVVGHTEHTVPLDEVWAYEGDAMQVNEGQTGVVQTAQAEVGGVIYVDERSGRNIIRTANAAGSSAIHSRFESVEPGGVTVPYLVN